MLFSRNPASGVLECYTDDGVYIGVMATMGDTLDDDKPTTDGGPGSGNFGHKGRPGQVGGSGGGGGSAQTSSQKSSGKSARAQKAAAYLPVKGSDRYYRHQGWNKERNAFLKEQGYSESDINTLSSLIDQHVRSAHSADNEMNEFASSHKEMLLDVAAFETEAAKIRNQMDIDSMDEDIGRLEESKSDLGWMANDPKDREYLREQIDEKIDMLKRQQERLKGEPVLYRKGDYDSPVLSFTSDPNGAVLHEGTEHEVVLFPDHSDTLSDLEKQGIVPVSGFGAINNFYGEGEVTCVKLPDSANNPESKEGNPQAVENNTKERRSGGGGTNFQSADEFRQYLTGSPKENVAATRAHIKDAAWMKQRDKAISNGVLPKSGFDRSERVVRDVVMNMLKAGKFKIIKSSFQDFRATLTDPRLKGTVFDYDDKGGIVAISSTTTRLSCSREKGYHVYPVKEGDVE